MPLTQLLEILLLLNLLILGLFLKIPKFFFGKLNIQLGTLLDYAKSPEYLKNKANEIKMQATNKVKQGVNSFNQGVNYLKNEQQIMNNKIEKLNGKIITAEWNARNKYNEIGEKLLNGIVNIVKSAKPSDNTLGKLRGIYSISER